MARKVGCFLKESEKVLMATKHNRKQHIITIQVKKWLHDLLHLKVGVGAKQISAHATQREMFDLFGIFIVYGGKYGTFDMEIEITCSTAEHAEVNTFTTTVTFEMIVRRCDIEYESAWMDAIIDQLSRNALHARFMKEKLAFHATVGRIRRRRRAELFTNGADHFIFLVGINKF
ncbi:hypothetical protein GOBAR_AA34348 [Gossypium barbadense]|uniref:Uncharacterized protein n=1 Tax=Gossypium barbadense TaxID=3634 RepID=A0A2P5W5K3_GOSBA|nr:hypothetical protein GOBAR_AA34348 [Gossypium barbadense]